MDFKQIQELIKMINNTEIGELTIEQKDFKITIKQKEANVTQFVSAGAPVQQFAPQQIAPQQQTQSLPPSSSGAGSQSSSGGASTSQAGGNTITIKSPMIGTFYRKSAPDKPNLVDVGDEVSPGKVVCIIEAMKLFNEIESEVKGKIVKVLVEDSSPVEYDQPLFLVEPS